MSYSSEEVAQILSVRWRVGFSDGSGWGSDSEDEGAWIVTERRVIRRSGELPKQGIVVYAGGEEGFMGVSSPALAREIVASHNADLARRKRLGFKMSWRAAQRSSA